MRIGFFGDSYVDVFLSNDITKQHSWSFKLLEEFESPILTTGYSGTNQFHAIKEWQKFCQLNKKLDVAIWTFTWENRLYSEHDINQHIFSAAAELKTEEIKERYHVKYFTNPSDPNLINNLILAHDLYQKYVHNDDQAEFLYTLMLQWILKLPEQYPEIKFIFIPNTELANTITKQYFKSGVLLDFAFETLSNLEPESPGAMPINCGRVGHLNSKNIDIFKDSIKEIILNYSDYQNKIHKIDYNKFDIRQ